MSKQPADDTALGGTTDALAEARRRAQDIPISLGKASLRQRLEAYYGLIAPETLSPKKEWLERYDQIFEKYGGSHQGEKKLASKLAKKYGTAVRLLLAKSVEESVPSKPHAATNARSEEWYQLQDNERDSCVIDALSSSFDPVAALTASTDQMHAANPWMRETSSTILDNVDKFATQLPLEDPQRRDLSTFKRKSTAAAAAASATESRKRPPASLHPFAEIAQHLDTGPISVLYRLQKKRITITVRY
ncbi:MAG: hypothetical protein SGARI_005192, partial [Bacillariaceae sp.]